MWLAEGSSSVTRLCVRWRETGRRAARTLSFLYSPFDVQPLEPSSFLHVRCWWDGYLPSSQHPGWRWQAWLCQALLSLASFLVCRSLWCPLSGGLPGWAPSRSVTLQHRTHVQTVSSGARELLSCLWGLNLELCSSVPRASEEEWMSTLSILYFL